MTPGEINADGQRPLSSFFPPLVLTVLAQVMRTATSRIGPSTGKLVIHLRAYLNPRTLIDVPLSSTTERKCNRFGAQILRPEQSH